MRKPKHHLEQIVTEVYLSKADNTFGGDTLVAKFRLWTEAKAVALAMTAARPGLRMFVSGHLHTSGRSVCYVFEGGRDTTEEVMMRAGGPFPIVGETAA